MKKRHNKSNYFLVFRSIRAIILTFARIDRMRSNPQRCNRNNCSFSRFTASFRDDLHSQWKPCSGNKFLANQNARWLALCDLKSLLWKCHRSPENWMLSIHDAARNGDIASVLLLLAPKTPSSSSKLLLGRRPLEPPSALQFKSRVKPSPMDVTRGKLTEERIWKVSQGIRFDRSDTWRNKCFNVWRSVEETCWEISKRGRRTSVRLMQPSNGSPKI
jgi:hypothetical protein